MIPRMSSLILLFSLVIILQCQNSISKPDVVTLTDATFEHETQATTGSTTGSWLILFKTDTCTHCTRLISEFTELTSEPELQDDSLDNVFGIIDIDTNPKTIKRFQIDTIPTFLYLRKGKMYEYVYSSRREGYESLKGFLLDGYNTEEEKTIPPPPGLMDELGKILIVGLNALVDSAYGNRGTVGYAALVAFALICMSFGAFMAKLILDGKPTPKRKKN
mmetsp:Transcript_28705/g.29046  ORF Transcript_28705/g.29046 Transcript_28705/m.29046 type:complete len:219 (-) Transcript_28705:369-1025(-)